jgi:cyclase
MTHQLKPNIYWIEGGGGNSTVIVGDKGVIVVDAKTTPDQGKEYWPILPKLLPSRSPR